MTTDLQTRIETFAEGAAPDLWPEILERADTANPAGARPAPKSPFLRRPATLAALCLVIVVGGLAVWTQQPHPESVNAGPSTEAATTTVPTTTSLVRTEAAVTPSDADWDAVAECETNGDWTAVSESGVFRGGLQFDEQTWRSVGEDGDPAVASRDEQIRRANLLWQVRGPEPWPSCGKELSTPHTFRGIAHLSVPAAGIDTPTIGAVDGTLVGHYPTTALPGHGATVAFYGQRSTYGAEFADIDQLAAGDQIVVTTTDGSFTYVVDQVSIIEPDDLADQLLPGDREQLVLTANNPRSSRRERIIVVALPADQ